MCRGGGERERLKCAFGHLLYDRRPLLAGVWGGERLEYVLDRFVFLINLQVCGGGGGRGGG